MEEMNRQNWIDQAIQEAQDRGLFDDLKGKGRPIDWEDESLVDDEWILAFRIMREHGFAPEWIELLKDIDERMNNARESVMRAWLWRNDRLPDAHERQRRFIETEWQRARADFVEAISEINADIADFNLIVPISRLQKFKLDVDQELASLGIEG